MKFNSMIDVDYELTYEYVGRSCKILRYLRRNETIFISNYLQ